MTAMTRTTSKSNSAASTMLYCGLIFTFIASLILSVEAINCHQCNSHLNEDCIGLRLSLPSAKLDEQYLKPCENKPGFDSFCRKTVVTIEATGENRIVRSCGWLNMGGKQDYCFSADNEGYLQTICSCYTDGCNSAPSQLSYSNTLIIFSLAGVLLWIFSTQFRY